MTMQEEERITKEESEGIEVPVPWSGGNIFILKEGENEISPPLNEIAINHFNPLF